MTAEPGRDLGHGVRVCPADGGEVVVQSAHCDLGWRARAGDHQGSAVLWEGSSFEVVGRERWRNGARWRLAPWTGDRVMRGVLPLDEAAVASAAAEARASARAARLRPWMWLLAPLLGLAIGPWQRRWRDSWGFPAALATWVSAIFEALFGAACMIELIASIGGGTTVFPWIPRLIAIMGAALLPEGLFRMAQVAADSEPVGSVVGLVVSIVERPARPPAAAVPEPAVHALDEPGGVLELVSPVQRRDWEEPGLLPYRGDAFRLSSTRRIGSSWLYAFSREAEAELAAERSLRLYPTPTRAAPPARERAPGFVRVVLLTAAATLAPCRFQQRWAKELKLRPAWLTVIGASAELIGGITNLRSAGGDGSFLVLLDLFFVGEAVVRFAAVALKGRPLGSVLGLPLVPLLERHLPEAVVTGEPEDRQDPSRHGTS